MRVDLYTPCWNDGLMLPFFFRHYDDLVQRYVVYDDGSTDDSLALLRSHPKVEIRALPPDAVPDSRIASNHAVLEHCWKESRGAADWVIVTDIDEHLYHPNLHQYLARCLNRGVTIVPALGYAMMSREMPADGVRLCGSLTMGAPHVSSSKLSVFSPNGISASNFAVGRHSAAPSGDVVAPARDEVLLLHYKYLGFERLRQRHDLFRTRQRPGDLASGWGSHYSHSDHEFMAVWDGIAERLVDVSRSDLRPWENHRYPRWWSGIEREPSWRRRLSRRTGAAMRPFLAD